MTYHPIFIFVPHCCQLGSEQYHMPSLLHGNISWLPKWVCILHCNRWAIPHDWLDAWQYILNTEINPAHCTLTAPITDTNLKHIHQKRHFYTVDHQCIWSQTLHTFQSQLGFHTQRLQTQQFTCTSTKYKHYSYELASNKSYIIH